MVRTEFCNWVLGVMAIRGVLKKMFCVIMLCFLLSLDFFTSVSNGFQKKRLHRQRTLVSAFFSTSNVFSYSKADGSKNPAASCHWLKNFRRQSRQCRKRKGLSEALITAKNLAVSHCEDQFRFDRWNCSHQQGLFKTVYRETSYMYAITASALTYSIARACSERKLHNCRCAAYRSPTNTRLMWKWGGCGDNIKDAKRIAKKMLYLRNKSDALNEVLNHNTDIGIDTVVGNEMKICKCHGPSSSCVTKTCWNQIKPFNKIAKDLKISYHNAIQVKYRNDVRRQVVKWKKNKPKQLLYLARRLDFCPKTAGRRCTDIDNCATLCCDRGFEENVIVLNKECYCRWRDCCFSVVCERCIVEQNFYSCK